MKVVSIQVQAARVETTKADDTVVQLVPQADESATHWAVYLRKENGEVMWLKDFPIRNRNRSTIRFGIVKGENMNWNLGRVEAYTWAATCSMEYDVPIEKVF